MTLRLYKKPYIVGIVSALVYAAFILCLFYVDKNDTALGDFTAKAGLYVMTFGFLACVPFAIGWITVTPMESDARWYQWLFLPLLPVVLSDAILFALGREGAICILFSLPISFLFAMLGGLCSHFYNRQRRKKQNTILCFAVVPFLLCFAESHRTVPLDVRTVETSIIIHAPADVVWRNIASVSAITPSELRPTWTHRLGFPRPIAATLDHEGIGGVRKASFEGNVLFTETISDWQPEKTLAFSIQADTSAIPATTLDEHVTIGGQYFDVLNGRYMLEPRPKGDIVLHLVSHERISTDFNWYAGLWTDGVMRSLQQSILEVIQHRCEAEAATR